MRWVLFLILIPSLLFSQTEKPFAKEISAFKKTDSIQFPAANQILFVGSSSFTFWKDVQSYFPGYPIVNRGFGGSTLKDLIFYFDELVKPYHARQIVIYSGENDLAYDKTATPDTVIKRFKILFSKIRAMDTRVPVTYVSMKPSPSRKNLMIAYEDANELIRRFLKSQKRTSFVDVYHKMLDANGNPMKELFLADSLHMKPNGYILWQKEMKSYLKKR
jgi:lysophospholipase L1-like esterase